jgi:hypothetical protein
MVMKIVSLDALGYKFTVGKVNVNLNNNSKVTKIIKNEDSKYGFIVFFEDGTEADIITKEALVLWG